MTDKDQTPDNLQLFIPLKFSGYYQGEDSESECLNYQFLLYGTTALVYNRKQLLAVPGIILFCYLYKYNRLYSSYVYKEINTKNYIGQSIDYVKKN
jgi:hypothetical protein